MTDDDDAPGTKDEDIIAEAKRRFTRCQDYEATARANFIADVKFGNGDERNGFQWEAQIITNRELERKPCLTINKAQVHANQIVNDARQNKTGIEVRPTGGGATTDAAEVFEGIVRHIEYVSRAPAAYDTATWNQVYGGLGYCRVHVDYVDNDSFDQDILIQRVADPLSVYLDPDIQQYDGSDARFGFVFRDEQRADAKAKWPELIEDGLGAAPLGNADAWDTKEHVRVCEYFRVGAKDDELILLPDEMCQALGAPSGTTVRKSVTPKELLKQIPKDARRRKVTEPDIEWFLIVGDKIADRKPWLGKYIPIARCVGIETVIDGQMDRKGHIRCLLSPQKMFNYSASSSVEFVAGQTKTPWLATPGAIENQETYWWSSNTVNHAVLLWNPTKDDGTPNPEPRRIEPPTASQGYVQGMSAAESQMMLASGQYQAVMGAPSNETSGKAINARQRQGDNATYHFVDHQAQMIAHIGRIVLDLIPKVYDTPRVIKILCADDTQMSVQIDPKASDAVTKTQDRDSEDFDPQKIAAIFNPNVGEYDVMSDVGPSYETSRQEAFNAGNQIFASHPESFSVIGDIWMDNADFPGAKAMAKRLKNMVPPAALGGPSREMQQMQQHMQQAAQAGQAQIEQLHAALQEAKMQLADKSADQTRDEYKAETDRLRVVGGIDPEALRPVLREVVSQALGQHIMPLMQAHQAAMAPAAPPPVPGMPDMPPSTSMPDQGQGAPMNGQ
jgi:hypothetical protein